MNRIIKFRAWDNSTGQMIFHDELLKYDGYYLMLANKLKGMEFTGVHDKNGKEIYEGDIINMEDGTRNPYKVVYADNFCGFGLDGNPGGLNVMLAEYVKDCTVIGNIYENPELLTK